MPRRPRRRREAGSASTRAASLAWALRASRSPVALVRDGRLAVRNAAWRAAERRAGAGWRVAGAAGHRGLADAALAEAAGLLRDRGGERDARLEREGAPDVLALRLEVLERRGAPVVLVLARDVTERARGERELARAREQRAAQERMRAVGELASGVAHDLNNVLHAMALRIDVLRRDAAAAGERRDQALAALARMVEGAAARVSRLQDLAFRRCDAPASDLDLRGVVDEALEAARPELARAHAPGEGAVRVELDLPALPRLVGSAGELRDVFVGLLLNARDAMPGGGTVRVSARWDGERVLVTVRDDGPGIAREALPRIFDPFFTTKGRKGTGLGLAIARSVMLRLGGDLRARNDHGAVFELAFPVSSCAPRPERPAAVAPPGGARVLVVDDDPDVLEAVSLVLEDLGQVVDTAPSGPAALAQLDGGARYDLVLCDVGMPGMSGWSVAEQVRRRAPGVRLFLITGWAREIGPDDARRGLVDGILPKPLPVDALRALLATAAPGERRDPTAAPETGAVRHDGRVPLP
jgi:signal transduction histidine kinase/CheY-like chemotaxis protein